MSAWKPTHVVLDSESGGREGAFVMEYKGEYYTKKGWERTSPLSNGVADYFRPIRASDTREDLLKRLREMTLLMEKGPEYFTLHEAINFIEASSKQEVKVQAFLDALHDLTS